MDPESPIRKQLMELLEPHFRVREEVTLRTPSAQKVRADLVAVAREFEKPFAIAIEIKSKPPFQPKNYRDTFLQAYRYVGAEIVEPNGFNCFISLAMIYQNRERFHYSIRNERRVTPELIEQCQMDGIELAFNSLGVGRIAINHGVIEFWLSQNCLWSPDKRWMAEFNRRFPDARNR